MFLTDIVILLLYPPEPCHTYLDVFVLPRVPGALEEQNLSFSRELSHQHYPGDEFRSPGYTCSASEPGPDPRDMAGGFDEVPDCPYLLYI